MWTTAIGTVGAAWYFKDSAEEIALGAGLHSYATGGYAAWAVKNPKVFGQAVGVGYVTGAAVGIMIAGHFWGQEGASDAAELYTDPEKFWNEGLLAMHTNAWTIGKHYMSKIF